MRAGISNDKFFIKKDGKVARFKKYVYLLAGNHSFDNVVDEESKYMNRLSRKKDEIKGEAEKDRTQMNEWVKINGDPADDKILETATYLYPRFIRVNSEVGVKDTTSPKIQFLDLNTQLLICVQMAADDETKYNKCSEGALNMYSYPSYADAKKYLLRTIAGIKLFNKDTSDWRVIRAHHNPFNNEDGDMNCFVTSFTVDKKPIDLMALIEAADVKVIIASHTHNAQFSMVNFATIKALDNTVKTYTYTPTDAVEAGKDCIKNTLTGTADAFVACGGAYTQEVTTKKDGADNLHIFVVGNSGREYDSLKNGHRSIAAFIWGRASGLASGKTHTSEVYGGANFNFTKGKVVATYFEGSSNPGTVVATITVTKADTSPTTYALLANRKARPTRRRATLKN